MKRLGAGMKGVQFKVISLENRSFSVYIIDSIESSQESEARVSFPFL